MAPRINARPIPGVRQSGARPAGSRAIEPAGSSHTVIATTGIPDWVHNVPIGAIANQGPAPAVTVVAPATGTSAGGTAITITGTGFDAVQSVKIGGVAVTSLVVVSLTSITCVTGAHGAGVVDVIVTTAHGVSPVVAADHFTYT